MNRLFVLVMVLLGCSHAAIAQKMPQFQNPTFPNVGAGSFTQSITPVPIPQYLLPQSNVVSQILNYSGKAKFNPSDLRMGSGPLAKPADGYAYRPSEGQYYQWSDTSHHLNLVYTYLWSWYSSTGLVKTEKIFSKDSKKVRWISEHVYCKYGGLSQTDSILTTTTVPNYDTVAVTRMYHTAGRTDSVVSGFESLSTGKRYIIGHAVYRYEDERNPEKVTLEENYRKARIDSNGNFLGYGDFTGKLVLDQGRKTALIRNSYGQIIGSIDSVAGNFRNDYDQNNPDLTRRYVKSASTQYKYASGNLPYVNPIREIFTTDSVYIKTSQYTSLRDYYRQTSFYTYPNGGETSTMPVLPKKVRTDFFAGNRNVTNPFMSSTKAEIETHDDYRTIVYSEGKDTTTYILSSKVELKPVWITQSPNYSVEWPTKNTVFAQQSGALNGKDSVVFTSEPVYNYTHMWPYLTLTGFTQQQLNFGNPCVSCPQTGFYPTKTITDAPDGSWDNLVNSSGSFPFGKQDTADYWTYRNNVLYYITQTKPRFGNSISLFPNPVLSGNSLILKAPENVGLVSGELQTIEGKTVQKIEPFNQETRLPIQSLAAGSYVVKLQTKAGTEYHRVLIQ